MKSSFIFFSIFYFVSQNSFAQENVADILQKSLKANDQITNGSYDATFKVKYLTRNDTSLIKGKCRFQRMLSDTLKGAKFELWANNLRVMYDGRFKISMYDKDSVAIVHDKWKYALQLSGSMYHLLSDYFLNGSVDFKDAIKSSEVKKYLLADTIIDQNQCYHILIQSPADEISQNIKRHLYIKKDNFYLVGETTDLESRQHHQYSELYLYGIETNLSGLTNKYGMELVPQNYFVKKYVPDELSRLLSAGTKAPAFNLTSIDDKKISLYDLAGKTVILYFWNGLDQQCRLGLISLQKFYEKYATSNIEIIGLNVSDQANESLKKYLKKQKVTFDQVTGAQATCEKYNVIFVPTIYVIGKSGKIIDGFAPAPTVNLEKKLENIILKN